MDRQSDGDLGTRVRISEGLKILVNGSELVVRVRHALPDEDQDGAGGVPGMNSGDVVIYVSPVDPDTNVEVVTYSREQE